MVVGSGAREHALVWKLAQEPGVDRVLAAPGSAAMARIAECVSVRADDLEGLARVAAERGVDVTVVGPEAPLAAGIADLFAARGLALFGPTREAAQLEASKAFAKEVLVAAGVPTAAYRVFTSVEPARAFAREIGFPVVVKADGLAAGKGVTVCRDAEQAEAAIRDALERGRFGEAGRRIVVEEFLEGEEASFIALVDGRNVLPLAPAQDHKPVFDGDRGPNTGGMGACSPAPVVTPELAVEITRSIIEPTVAALADRGIPYRGVLYAGLMICDGRPKVLEYNVRFGDPECQPLMVRLGSSLAELIEAAMEGNLAGARADWKQGAAACVVMAARGYPGEYEKGAVIEGIERAEQDPGVTVFHAGTTLDEQGRWRTAGGRVLSVTAAGETIRSAVARAYEAVGKIHWEGVHYRRDIGSRAIARERGEVG
ncbi:MAG: phosphoribosylamine--glycine ligase [Candidatus Dadabacteria bacterium]|nr:MAG: phosphoribosylamine--glycine ligase [Candidatus Dadabacteria bacterium]